jgi:hypothetical protein
MTDAISQYGRLSQSDSTVRSSLDKANKKQGPAADGTIHVLCPISKAYYGGMLQEDPAPELPSTHNGCAIGRRREGAMLTLFSTAWRLGAMGLSSVENHHDLTNAFMSLDHSEFDKTVDEAFKPENVALVERLYKKALVVMRLCDGTLLAIPTTGGLMGHPVVVSLFVQTFRRAVAGWQMDQHQ